MLLVLVNACSVAFLIFAAILAAVVDKSAWGTFLTLGLAFYVAWDFWTREE